MRAILTPVFRFLPVQLIILHFRKYQLLLVFWLILFATIAGNFAAVFGASTLFLTPEYLGNVSFFSMFIVGGALGVFIMSWHITTFIIHSHRLSSLGAARHSFIKYCVNNSILPLIFLVWYLSYIIDHQLEDEHATVFQTFRFIIGFLSGLTLIIIISFTYFFRVDRNLLKIVLSRITNPSVIKRIIPYDTLDIDLDMVRADTYLTGRLKLKKFSELEPYSAKFMQTVLRMHHRNAITATIFALLVLWVSGFFIDEPRLRLPAAAGFLLLFSVVMGVVGAMKYFLRSWEVLGWMVIITLLSALVKYHVFDVRSIAYGMDYNTAIEKPKYNHDSLVKIFSPTQYEHDKLLEEQRLTKWNERRLAENDSSAPMIIVAVSGGGTRAAYWSFRILQYLDSLSSGKFYKNTVMMTGASGGMIGTAYWRELHSMYSNEKRITKPYDPQYQENIGKDLLNAIVFSLVSVDLVSPFNKIAVAGHSYKKDRGYAMEQEMILNTNGVFDTDLGKNKHYEQEALMPGMIVNGTIINDGKRLMMSSLPVGYLTRPAYSIYNDSTAAIDAIDFATFFKNQNPYKMRLTTALRMNATFPYILPVVRLPSDPEMNIMDAGLRDNFGMEVAFRYIYTMSGWIKANHKKVILLQIRDTREATLFPQSEMNTLSRMVSNPLFAIQAKWESFQSYNHSYLKDYASAVFGDELQMVSMEYIPDHFEKSAALNFHLTNKEKKGLMRSVYHPRNVRSTEAVIQALK